MRRYWNDCEFVELQSLGGKPVYLCLNCLDEQKSSGNLDFAIGGIASSLSANLGPHIQDMSTLVGSIVSALNAVQTNSQAICECPSPEAQKLGVSRFCPIHGRKPPKPPSEPEQPKVEFKPNPKRKIIFEDDK